MLSSLIGCARAPPRCHPRSQGRWPGAAGADYPESSSSLLAPRARSQHSASSRRRVASAGPRASATVPSPSGVLGAASTDGSRALFDRVTADASPAAATDGVGTAATIIVSMPRSRRHQSSSAFLAASRDADGRAATACTYFDVTRLDRASALAVVVMAASFQVKRHHLAASKRFCSSAVSGIADGGRRRQFAAPSGFATTFSPSGTSCRTCREFN